MAEINFSQETIKSMLSSLATTHANKSVVDLMVVDSLFEHDRDTSHPFTKLDGTIANYYTFFKKYYLLEPSSKLKEEDSQLYHSSKILYNFITACEEQNEDRIKKYAVAIFDANIAANNKEFIEQLRITEDCFNNYGDNLNLEEKEGIIKNSKSSYVLQNTLSHFRKSLAISELTYNFKYPTLEYNIEAIIYATISLTENLLSKHGIESTTLSYFWSVPDHFSGVWFAATIPDNEEESVAVRKQIIDASEEWPEYARHSIFILDYAAIIQDRLFVNHHFAEDLNWRKESFKIWNSYAAAALRLGEIFNKYKNNLPFDDEELKWLNGNLEESALIITEGKTDWKHLKKAYHALLVEEKVQDLKIQFHKYSQPIGQDKLVTMCKSYAQVPHRKPIIFIADSDTPKIIEQLNSPNAKFKSWGNNVFSFCIPTPPHREKYKNISIEFYYSDDEIHTVDQETGRKLLFTNEVQHTIIQSLTYKKPIKHEWTLIASNASEEFDKKIFDDNYNEIVDKNGNNVACSKAVFAENVYSNKNGFTNFNFDNFKLIFDIIEQIILSIK